MHAPGVGFGLAPEGGAPQSRGRLSSVRQLIQLVAPHRGRVAAAVLAGGAFAAGTGLLAVAVGVVSDVVFGGGDGAGNAIARHGAVLPSSWRALMERAFTVWRPELEPGSGSFALLLSLIPLAMLLRGFGGYLTTYWTHWVAARSVHDLRVDLYRHLQGLSLDFFHQARTGDLISRISNDTQQLQQGLANGIATAVRDPVTVVMLAGILLSRQARLTGIALVVFPLVVVPVVVFGRRLRRSARATQVHTAELSDVMQETFTATRVVKAYNLEEAVIRRFVETSQRIVSQYLRMIRASEFPGPLIELFGALGATLLLYYVAGMGVGRPSQGEFNTFLTCLFALYQPIKNLARLYGHIEQGRAVLDRVAEIRGHHPTVLDPPAPRPLNARGADIEFEHVTFRYGEKTVLDDFHLRIPCGSLVALVGPTGAGKTTVSALLLRFMDPASGAVRIGGVDLRDVSGQALRDQIAVVTQETLLFNETIRANIGLGRRGATTAEIVEAARKAHADAFIEGRPEGFETPIGEKGVALSGGQRQRIALARAILRDAPILILDEATNALDSETEQLVHEALEEHRRGRTTLCIAHRLSTIQEADMIVVLDQGRMVEVGTHEQLMAKDGVYRRLRDLQFRD